MIYSRYVKDRMERIMILFLGMALIPFFIVICLCLLITQGNSIFFLQKRSGKNRKGFLLIKFRTLLPDVSKSLSLENRTYTYFGKILRTSGIDELPQIINILRGEMTLIGPRPMPVEYNPRYSQAHLNRFRIKPGITGWAQIHGKNSISWGRRFELDSWYVDNVSFRLDLKIIWMTIIKFFTPSKEEVKMEVFNGSNLA